MAGINTQDINLSGLAALSGKSAPQLNLPLWSLHPGDYNQTVLAGMQKAADLQEKYAEQGTQTNIAKIGEQGATQRALFAAANAASMQQNEIASQQGIAQMNNQRMQDANTNTANYQQGMLGYRKDEINNQTNNINTRNQYLNDKLGLQAQANQLEVQKAQAQQAQQALKNLQEAGTRKQQAIGALAAQGQVIDKTYQSGTPEWIAAKQQLANIGVREGVWQQSDADQ